MLHMWYMRKSKRMEETEKMKIILKEALSLKTGHPMVTGLL